jgi:tRNA wybutosine-synthesizing protein 3|tara:strand:+ start:18106 stop:18945 length:840 start_codon:yes stop_codon:yes gene_type:complete
VLNYTDLENISSLLDDIPKRWEKFADIVLLPNTAFKKKHWEPFISDEFWLQICNGLEVKRLARLGEIIGEKRESTVEILVGDNDWVIRKESGIKYGYHLTQCMFSSGNVNERRRMGEVVSKGEIIVDLFCGIGYYTLPILVKSQAKHVYSCEWNINAINALKYNLKNNKVEDRCTIYEGDNRITSGDLFDTADRVLLGLLPTAEKSFDIALNCLKDSGGILHLHGLAPADNYEKFIKETTENIENKNLNYIMKNIHVNKIKSYAPHWDHLVLDIEMRKK